MPELKVHADDRPPRDQPAVEGNPVGIEAELVMQRARPGDQPDRRSGRDDPGYEEPAGAAPEHVGGAPRHHREERADAYGRDDHGQEDLEPATAAHADDEWLVR
jgi:hypothetical protein